MKKRGQFWYSDFMIGVLIMITIGILFFSAMVNLYKSNDTIDDLINEGILISDYFMSPGYQVDQWSSGDGRIGFVSNGKINENFDEFQSLDYNLSRTLLGIHYNYFVYFEDDEGNIEDVKGPGNLSSSDLETLNVDYMVKLVRFVYYNGDIQKMVVVLWK